MTPQSVECLMSDIEDGDPLDFSDLAIAEDDARRLMAGYFCELDRRLADSGLDTEARLTVMAAIAAHTMQANFLLQIQGMRGGDREFDLRAWMQRHGFG